MAKVIDYFFTPISPWTYLGHDRFVALAKQAGAEVRIRPVDYGRIFPASGGLPLAKRPPQRQAYRLEELKRWRGFLRLPLNLQPGYFPVRDEMASRTIIAADQAGQDALALAGAILRACWAEEKNVADGATLAAIADGCGLDGGPLVKTAETDAIKAVWNRYTEEAIASGVFGAPTYVIDGELFWGQDRLNFVERALAA